MVCQRVFSFPVPRAIGNQSLRRFPYRKYPPAGQRHLGVCSFIITGGRIKPKKLAFIKLRFTLNKTFHVLMYPFRADQESRRKILGTAFAGRNTLIPTFYPCFFPPSFYGWPVTPGRGKANDFQNHLLDYSEG